MTYIATMTFKSIKSCHTRICVL